jgi:hypothetical protein
MMEFWNTGIIGKAEKRYWMLDTGIRPIGIVQFIESLAAVKVWR